VIKQGTSFAVATLWRVAHLIPIAVIVAAIIIR
jgi:hypothetical protein